MGRWGWSKQRTTTKAYLARPDALCEQDLRERDAEAAHALVGFRRQRSHDLQRQNAPSAEAQVEASAANEEMETGSGPVAQWCPE